jgi:hypothetical protein
LNNVHTRRTGVSWIQILGMELESILALPLLHLNIIGLSLSYAETARNSRRTQAMFLIRLHCYLFIVASSRHIGSRSSRIARQCAIFAFDPFFYRASSSESRGNPIRTFKNLEYSELFEIRPCFSLATVAHPDNCYIKCYTFLLSFVANWRSFFNI